MTVPRFGPRGRSTQILLVATIAAAGIGVGPSGCGRGGTPSASQSSVATDGGGGSATDGAGSGVSSGGTGTGGAGSGGAGSSGGSGPSSGAPSARDIPARDSFTGTITAGTGRYVHRRGTTAIYLHLGSRSTTVRSLDLALRGRACKQAPRCLRLSGTVSGVLMLVSRHLPADIGRGFSVRAGGSVAPLGQVTLRGTGHGSGFIARGREQLRIVLKGANGTLTILAHSTRVRAFTSP
jgi:hypothetical protein